MKKKTVFCIFLIFSFGSVFGIEKSDSKKQVICNQKRETVNTIFRHLPESERSCAEIAKLVLTEEDEDGEKLSSDYNALFLQVCELKRKQLSLEEIQSSLGLSKDCYVKK
ncbi:hypothetical protein P3G55_08535 [Leptospira sp. 96542]|nr:hypothetical protein [Leptospira sp. 96542]